MFKFWRLDQFYFVEIKCLSLITNVRKVRMDKNITEEIVQPIQFDKPPTALGQYQTRQVDNASMIQSAPENEKSSLDNPINFVVKNN